MNFTITQTELSLIFSYIMLLNFIHLSFGEGMILEWLYRLLEGKFRRTYNAPFKKAKWYYNFEDNILHAANGFISKKEIGGLWTCKEPFRNKYGLLYIAKPIYACITCMPSLWCIPTLYLGIKTYIIVAISVSVLATLLYRILDKLNS